MACLRDLQTHGQLLYRGRHLLWLNSAGSLGEDLPVLGVSPFEYFRGIPGFLFSFKLLWVCSYSILFFRVAKHFSAVYKVIRFICHMLLVCSFIPTLTERRIFQGIILKDFCCSCSSCNMTFKYFSGLRLGAYLH